MKICIGCGKEIKGIAPYHDLSGNLYCSFKCRFKKNKDIIVGTATYWGGHFLYPAGKRGDAGKIIINNDKILFEKEGFLGKKWEIEIPFKKIIWKKVQHSRGEDKNYKNFMTASSFFAGQGAITSYSRDITFIIIPYKDEKGLEQSPKFSIDKHKVLEKISKLLYDKMGDKK